MIPSYIHKSVLNKETINHEWDDWDPYELISDSSEDTIQSLNTLSLSGMLCFCCWVHRMGNLSVLLR